MDSDTSELVFAETFGQRDLRLFEVDETLLAQVENSQCLTLRGNESLKDAVLCGPSSTFVIKKVETSNQLFVASEGSLLTQCNFYYELTSVAPTISLALHQQLKRTEYKSAVHDAELAPGSLISPADLRQMLLCSDEEYDALLTAHGIVALKGAMRMISREALLEVIGGIIDTMIGLSLDYLALSEGECCNALQGTDTFLIRYALSRIGKECDTMMHIWSLDYNKLCGYSARLLLQSDPSQAVKGWPLHDFMAIWAARTPTAANQAPKLDHLQGVALLAGEGKVVKYVDSELLPVEPKALLSALFEVKSLLTTEELLPYVSHCYGAVGQPATHQELLMQYSTEDFFCRYYVGQHGMYGHEYMEFELYSDGRLRYANNSSYKNSNLIRKEAYVGKAVIDEVKRIIADSEIFREDDREWPLPDKNTGSQELEIKMNNEHICFACAKIGSLSNVQASKDPEGMRVFYYLVQDLKCLVLSLITMHFKIKPIP